jgi:hypothetical protein
MKKQTFSVSTPTSATNRTPPKKSGSTPKQKGFVATSPAKVNSKPPKC